MEPQLTPGATASLAINAIRQQMQNALSTLENQSSFLLESIEQSESVSAAEYDKAIDSLEAQYQFTDQQKQEIELLKLEVHSLKEKQAEFELAALDEQRKALTELRTSNISLKRQDADNQLKMEKLSKIIAEADSEVQQLRRQDKYRALYNLHLKKHFFAEEDKDKSVPYFAYVIPHGLQSLDEQLLDLEWKIFVMSATGEGVAVLMSEWICPTLPPCQFAREVPKELVDAIMHFATDALAETHQPLIERATWSQQVLVRSVVTDKHADLLEQNGILTLHDIMLHQAFKLSKIKGIGDKTAQAIMDLANKYVADNYKVNELEAA